MLRRRARRPARLKLKKQRLSQDKTRLRRPPPMTVTVDKPRPTRRTGMVTSTPVNGPAHPTSSRARLSSMGERMRMKAPKVPMMKGMGGAGMKYGRVTSN